MIFGNVLNAHQRHKTNIVDGIDNTQSSTHSYFEQLRPGQTRSLHTASVSSHFEFQQAGRPAAVHPCNNPFEPAAQDFPQSGLLEVEDLKVRIQKAEGACCM